MPTPTPAFTPAPPLTAIDQILADLDKANVAFNAPQRLDIEELAIIQLILSTGDQPQLVITAPGEIVTAEGISVATRMEARLTGPGFRIEAITPEVQAVSGAEDTEWKWEIEPTRTGTQRLHLTLSALLEVDGRQTHRAIRTFEREIVVQVTPMRRAQEFLSNNWQWTLTVLVIPMVAWGIRNRGKLFKKGR